jgi:hypothetical protein
MRLDMPESARLFSANQLDNPICQHIQHIDYRPTLAMRNMRRFCRRRHKSPKTTRFCSLTTTTMEISDDDDRRELVIEAAVRYIVIKRISDEAEAKKKSAASEKQGDSAAS